MTERWGVVPAAGRGERFNGGVPKQYLHVAGGCVLDHSLDALLRGGRLRAVAVAVAEDDARWAQTRHSADPRVMLCTGGASRVRSVRCALELLGAHAQDDDWVVVHDAVRPCLSQRDLSSLIEGLGGDEIGGLLVAPASDTLKQIRRGGGAVERTLKRDRVMRALTPQMFRYGLLTAAVDEALRRSVEIGDEAQAMELAGHNVRVVEGDGANVKLTYPHELPLIEAWLARAAPPDAPGG